MTKPHRKAKTQAPATTPTAPATPKGWSLNRVDEPGKSEDRAMAEIAALGMAGNARAVVAFGAPTFGDLRVPLKLEAMRVYFSGIGGTELRQ